MSNPLKKLFRNELRNAKSIAWMGISADPPTLAHRSIVDAVLGSGLVQKIVVFPSGKLAYKNFEASDWERWDMMQLWKREADLGDELIINTFDLFRHEAYSWIDLWKALKDMSPKREHWLVVGSDQYIKIPYTWNQGEDLLQKANFLIVPRINFQVQNSPSHHYLIPVEPIEGSSTSARKGNLQLVDSRVRDYIQGEGIYQPLKKSPYETESKTGRICN